MKERPWTREEENKANQNDSLFEEVEEEKKCPSNVVE